MSTDAGHPYGTLRLGAVVIAASFAALVLLGVSGRAVASSSAPGPTSASAGAVVAEARAAMIRAGSVTAQGAGTTTLPGVGQATLTETDYAGPTSGSQELSTSSPGASPDSLPSADTVDVSGAVYVNADASFWTATVGIAPASATPIAGRWVRIPEGGPVYAAAAADLTMPSLVHDLFHARHYQLIGVRTVDGERVDSLTARNTGTDAGPVTVDVSVGGSHLPVLVTIGGLSLHLGSWGTAQPLAAPAGSVPMPDLDGTMPSGRPAVA
jgi:hypothetical protein